LNLVAPSALSYTGGSITVAVPTTAFKVLANISCTSSVTVNVSGSPNDGQNLHLRFLDNGTAQTISWSSSFFGQGGTLPSTTVAGKYLDVICSYNAGYGKWAVLASQEQ
jgi:hypothetical protein